MQPVAIKAALEDSVLMITQPGGYFLPCSSGLWDVRKGQQKEEICVCSPNSEYEIHQFKFTFTHI